MRVKYRSNYEKTIAGDLRKLGFAYEDKSSQLQYIIPESKHTYLPDFVRGDLVIEAKGYMDLDTRKKMILVKKQNPTKRIVMVFQNPNLKINKKSKTRYRDWADKNGIEWTTLENLVSYLNTPPEN